MAKGNLFLGTGRGAVGDVVFTRIDGEQVARVRNRAPKNKQTPLQMLQRVVMKTCSGAYSLMQEICNHSFQGFMEGTECQSRFTRLNVGRLRGVLSEEIASGEAEVILSSTSSNFSGKNNDLAVINPYIVSEGSLPTIPCGGSAAAGCGILLGKASAAEVSAMTYQDVCDVLGLQQGDQLTVLLLSHDDTEAGDGSSFASFKYGRFILDPNDGDMTTVFLDPDNAGQVLKPNEKNQGQITLTASQPDAGNFGLVCGHPSMSSAINAVNSVGAIAVIASRYYGGAWLRSTQSLVLRSNSQWPMDEWLLGDAIWSYLDNVNSSLYLNQSGF